MKLTLKRRYKGADYTIGSLYVDGQYFCDTLEDRDRGLTKDTPPYIAKFKKVFGKTAIPAGEYRVTVAIFSPRFGSRSFYRKACGGRVPRLLDVPFFDGVLIHVGNTAADTDGCILVGENKVKGQVVNSRETFKRLYPLLWAAYKRNETITIEIR